MVCPEPHDTPKKKKKPQCYSERFDFLLTVLFLNPLAVSSETEC